ncbi:hypothetical protein Lal_00014922 [Lupinus albus]|nr:hypothetical protein Lal_00014922 [Lupinus albus]
MDCRAGLRVRHGRHDPGRERRVRRAGRRRRRGAAAGLAVLSAHGGGDGGRDPPGAVRGAALGRGDRVRRDGPPGRGAREAAAAGGGHGGRHVRVRRRAHVRRRPGRAARAPAGTGGRRRACAGRHCRHPAGPRQVLQSAHGRDAGLCAGRTHQPQSGQGVRHARPVRGVHRRSGPRAHDGEPVRKERGAAAKARRQHDLVPHPRQGRRHERARGGHRVDRGRRHAGAPGAHRDPGDHDERHDRHLLHAWAHDHALQRLLRVDVRLCAGRSTGALHAHPVPRRGRVRRDGPHGLRRAGPGRLVQDRDDDGAARRLAHVGQHDRLCRQPGGTGRRHDDLDDRGPHGPEGGRGIAAQRAAGKPGHPRQRRAGHRRRRKGPHPALQPQDGRIVRPPGRQHRRPARARTVSRRRGLARGARADPARFRGGARTHGRVRTGAARRPALLGAPVGPPVRHGGAGRAQRVADRRRHGPARSGGRAAPRARRTGSAGARTHGGTAGRDRRAAPGRGARAPHGVPRRAHRPAEPRAAVRPPRPRAAGGAPRRHEAGPDVHRPGPLQDHQRFARPPDGRPPAQGSGAAPVPRRARQRHRRAPRRRRIRRAGAGRARGRGVRPRGRQDHRGAGRTRRIRGPHPAYLAVDRHLPVSGRRRRRGGPDAQCRRRDVLREGCGPQQLPVLRRADERGGRAPFRARVAPARRAAARGIRAVLPAHRRHAGRPRARPGSAAALAPSGAGPRRARRLHPDPGRERPDRAGRRMGDPARVRTGDGVAARGPAAVAAGRQPVGAPVHAQGPDPRDPRRRRRHRHRSRPARIRDHGDGADAARRPDARYARPDLPHGHPAVDRRLRHGLFEPRLPEALPGPQDQDRPRLRARPGDERRGPGHRRGHHGARGEPRHGRRGGGRRERRATGAAAPPRLPVCAGLPVRAADGSRRDSKSAGRRFVGWTPGATRTLAVSSVSRASTGGRLTRSSRSPACDPTAGPTCAAAVAAERHLAVVPPAVLLVRLLEQAERVDETQAAQCAQLLAFEVGAVDLAGPQFGVVDVAVFRCDVVVAQDRELLVDLHLFADPRAQRVQPAHLVGVLVGTHGLAVRHVRADKAHAADGGGDQALLLVLVMGIVAHDVRDGQARQDRHPVVRLLAAEHDFIAGRVDVRHGELVVRELGLLDAEHVDGVGGEPLQQVRQADLQRVHVPGCDLHVDMGCGGRTIRRNPAVSWL